MLILGERLCRLCASLRGIANFLTPNWGVVILYFGCVAPHGGTKPPKVETVQGADVGEGWCHRPHQSKRDDLISRELLTLLADEIRL